MRTMSDITISLINSQYRNARGASRYSIDTPNEAVDVAIQDWRRADGRSTGVHEQLALEPLLDIGLEAGVQPALLAFAADELTVNALAVEIRIVREHGWRQEPYAFFAASMSALRSSASFRACRATTSCPVSNAVTASSA